MERYFAPSLPPMSIDVRLPDGRALLQMTDWSMAPHQVAGKHTFRVGASFSDASGTHRDGLRRNQDGAIDLRGRTIDCHHNYDASASE